MPQGEKKRRLRLRPEDMAQGVVAVRTVVVVVVGSCICAVGMFGIALAVGVEGVDDR